MRPSFGYGFLNKNLTYYKGSIYYEDIEELDEVSIRLTNHFLTMGANFSTKKNFIVTLNLQRSMNVPKVKDQIIFSEMILLFGITKEFEANKERSPFVFRPYVQYGIPMGEKGYFNTNPINIGLLIRIH